MYIRLGPHSLNDAWFWATGTRDRFPSDHYVGQRAWYDPSGIYPVFHRVHEGVVEFRRDYEDADGKTKYKSVAISVAEKREPQDVGARLSLYKGSFTKDSIPTHVDQIDDSEAEVRPTLGQYLTRRLMVGAGMRFPTSADIAERLGVHKATFGRLLSQDSVLSHDMAGRLVSAFGFDHIHLWNLCYVMHPPKKPPLPPLSTLDDRQQKLFLRGVDVGE